MCIYLLNKEAAMISPIKAIANSTMVTSPYATNPQMAYKNAANYSQRGEKLNIDCTETRNVVRNGAKVLDYYA